MTSTKRKQKKWNDRLDTNTALAIAVILVAAIGVGLYATKTSSPENKTPRLAATSQDIPVDSSAVAPVVSITPESVLQGDPVMIMIDGVTSMTTIQNAYESTAGAQTSVQSNERTKLAFTMYQGEPVSLYGVGINDKTGSSTVVVTFKNGSKISGTFYVRARVRPEEPLAIPVQIGGNSTANQDRIASALTTENAEIADLIPSMRAGLWTEPFAFPLETGITITDPYGYNRDTGEILIPHKGTDFRAASGTPVYAINDGVVSMTGTFIVYGNTVIVDHGIGIQSLYMHLSQIVATDGEHVTKGELLGYSGETGYAVGPHLHLSIKIYGVSIDPMRFFPLFGL